MSSTTSWLGSALALAMLASCVESETYTPVGDLTVSVPESFDIRNDSSADLPVTVTRGAGHTKAIALEVLGLPAGLTADPAEIPAGESAGTIKIHAAGATLATDFNVIVNARSHGITASDSSLLYVTGKPGTTQTIFTAPGLFPTSRFIGEIPTRVGYLIDISVGICLVDDRGKDVLSFAEGACIEPRNIIPAPPPSVEVDVHLAFLHDQKILGVTSYKAAQSTNDIDGLVFFRTTPNGKPDTKYGPGANSSVSFIALPGYNPRRIGVSETGEAVVWATHVTSGAKALVRVSAQGELINSRVLGAEGDLGVERSDLIVQADGKVVAAGSNQSQRFITRFNRDLTLDASFGYGGVFPTGARVAHVVAVPDGYVAVGQLSTVPTLWRLDSLGRPAPGFQADGVNFTDISSGFFSSVFATSDRIYVALNLPFAATVMGLNPDGTHDRSFGLDGQLHIAVLSSSKQVLEMRPSSHSRANIGIRESTPTVQYEITRFWY